MKIRLTMLFALIISTALSSQVSMTAGITKISDIDEGDTLNWSVGYSHFLSSFGIGASYGKVQLSRLNYNNVSVFAMHRFEAEPYRLDVGIGGNWNDFEYKTNPSIMIRNSIEIDKDLYVTVNVENAFRRNNITHFSIGFLINVDYKK